MTLTLGAACDPERGGRRKPQPGRRKSVGFLPSFLNSTHDVTPYARKYGVHPSFFNYDRTGRKRLSDEGIVEDIRRIEGGLGPLKLDGEA
jgi:hypothetical protein